MDWKAKVDLFEQLRREHEFGVGTIAGVAAKFGVHRRMVRQALANALPPPRQYRQRAKPKLDAVLAFIDGVLEEDRRAPRKQRHTARRLHRRLLMEFPGVVVAESTVRNHVRERKRAMGLVLRETFVPQSYALGQEAQVDWYEAWADLGGERTRVQVLQVLRNAGLFGVAEELAPVLPDVVDFDRDHELFERYGVDREDLVSRMGGSP